MTTETKQAFIANFNCTFGKNNEPMLNHFFDVILPAFSQEIQGKPKSFFFENVKLTNVKGEYALAGLIVKRTVLEIKSQYINGELVKTDESYPSAPYSYFVINLQNHRMVLVKNQKGSPTLANFSSLARDVLKSFISVKNTNLPEEEKIPQVLLNVVAIPFQGAILEELKKVKKIKNVTLRFYPLNGDIMDNETVEHLTTALKSLGSKTGAVSFNTPTEKENVAKVIEDTKGLMKPTIKVEYKNGTSGTLKDGSFTEVMNIQVEETESFGKNIDTITGKVINKPEFNELSEENKTIYNRVYGKLEEYYKKLFK
ncbi:hypothetical protein V2H29_01940 [Lysinibacillus fusiformis]|uniref:hypothetical protein n=1 Tax=Lysinibacillus TaxID=400634 RepID=UPI0023309D62|nr:hypothetical protein [Lysinibacillus sp. OF-1]MEE3805706.1 hypothetical protein [Lysinibacillus fusiformis]WCH46589.1 hypothetical protein NV349_16040 [Lysinibacillus sp. OF-1]